MAPGARNKFGAPMFEPELFQKQLCSFGESTCDIVGTFRRPRSHSALPTGIWRPPPVIRRPGIVSLTLRPAARAKATYVTLPLTEAVWWFLAFMTRFGDVAVSLVTISSKTTAFWDLNDWNYERKNIRARSEPFSSCLPTGPSRLVKSLLMYR